MKRTKKIGVVGLGLIGGSIAKDLRALGYSVMGHDRSEQHLSMASELGLIDTTGSLDDLCQHVDIIIVAVPVMVAPQVTSDLLDRIQTHQVVIDTGSTKASICDTLSTHPKRKRYVACHPLAGTEHSGPTAAISDLFRNKKNIICDEHLSDDDALGDAIAIMQELGMQNLFMSSEMHDQHMAYVSHLSHVSSFMLSNTVLDIEEDEKQIFNLASTGLESTVRLAKSSPDTWTDIFIDNADNVSTALSSYIKHLQTIKTLIDTKNHTQLKETLHGSNDIKRILNGMKYNIVKIS